MGGICILDRGTCINDEASDKTVEKLSVDFRESRRRTRRWLLVGCLLAVAVLAASLAAYDSRNGYILESKRLALVSESVLPTDRPGALDIALKAVAEWKTEEAMRAVAQAFPTPLIDLRAPCGGISRITFSTDGSRIATSASDRRTRVWDVNGDLVSTLAGMGGPSFYSLSFSPNGARLVTAGNEFAARVGYFNRCARGYTNALFASRRRCSIFIRWAPYSDGEPP
jgi:WD40 repeat protein